LLCTAKLRSYAGERKGAGGRVIYRPNFLPADDYRAVLEECQPILRIAKPEKNTLAKGRLGVYLPEGSKAVRRVLSEEVCTRVGRKVGAELLPGDFPVELRVYPVGSYMDWHSDEVMYCSPQYEMIYTLENTTDSETQWEDPRGGVVSQWAEPNSLIAIRAGGPLHQVTKSRSGRRSILKFVLTPTLDKTEEFHENFNRDAF